MWFPTSYGKSICYQLLPFVFDVKLGRTNGPLVDRSVVLVIFPLVSDSTRILLSVSFIRIFIEIYSIVLQHVLLLNLRSHPTRPYPINTRPYFSPATPKNQPGDKARAMYVQPHNYIEKWVRSASIHMVCVWSVTVLQCTSRPNVLDIQLKLYVLVSMIVLVYRMCADA